MTNHFQERQTNAKESWLCCYWWWHIEMHWEFIVGTLIQPMEYVRKNWTLFFLFPLNWKCGVGARNPTSYRDSTMLTMNLGGFFLHPRKRQDKKKTTTRHGQWCTIGRLVGAQPSPCCGSLAFSISEDHGHPNSSCKLITISTAQNSIFSLFNSDPILVHAWKQEKKTSTPKLNIIINAHPFGPLWMNKKNKQKITSTETLFKPSRPSLFSFWWWSWVKTQWRRVPSNESRGVHLGENGDEFFPRMVGVTKPSRRMNSQHCWVV